MIILLAFIAGFAIGWWRAAKRSGTTADRVQYALAHGIPAAIAGLIVVIIAARMGYAG